jgi:hypothetical protein
LGSLANRKRLDLGMAELRDFYRSLTGSAQALFDHLSCLRVSCPPKCSLSNRMPHHFPESPSCPSGYFCRRCSVNFAPRAAMLRRNAAAR